MVVVVGGRVLFEYADLKYVSKIASERKSVLAMPFRELCSQRQSKPASSPQALIHSVLNE